MKLYQMLLQDSDTDSHWEVLIKTVYSLFQYSKQQAVNMIVFPKLTYGNECSDTYFSN